MRQRIAFLLLTIVAFSSAVAAGTEAPIRYTVRIDPARAHTARVEATVPAEGRTTVDLMMAVWTPGFYKVENYATRVRDVSAHAPDGSTRTIAQPQPNHWRIDTGGAAAVIVTYDVLCNERSVTTNFVGNDYAVLNGAPTFMTLADHVARPHDVRVVMPPSWSRTMTALAPASDGAPHHYLASDYDTSSTRRSSPATRLSTSS